MNDCSLKINSPIVSNILLPMKICTSLLYVMATVQDNKKCQTVCHWTGTQGEGAVNQSTQSQTSQLPMKTALVGDLVASVSRLLFSTLGFHDSTYLRGDV